jgi:poly(3-hydroxybutyrate) depolymerase
VVIDVRFLSVSALLVSLVFCPSLPLANDSDSGQMHKRAMVHDGVQREYFVYVPKSKKSIPPPLVLGLHG